MKNFFFESGGMGTKKLLKFLEIVTNRYLQTCYSYKHPYTDTSAIGGDPELLFRSQSNIFDGYFCLK